MAESTLSITYSDLLAEVGRFLGYQGTADTWTVQELSEIDSYVQSGVRQFYYPPAIEGLDPGHEWSFLHPVTTIETEAGEQTQDLPDDLGRVQGDFYFEPEHHYDSIVVVSEGRVMAMSQKETPNAKPRIAAIRFKASDGTDGQRQEVVWWPTPDAAYELQYRYEAYSGKLSGTRKYPLGGMKFAELLIESCLAVAEQRANDESGLHFEKFSRMLIAAVEQDKKNGARYFGQMGEPVLLARDRKQLGPQYDITYKGETW